MKKIKGVIVPLLTPIDQEERPIHSQLAALTDYVIAGGVDAIFANGTTGEFARFTPEERIQNLKTIVTAAGGRVPVVAGISDCGTRLVLENAKAAQDAGADVLVTTLPYYFPTTSKKEQIDFLEKVATNARLPVMLYNIPSVVGCGVSEEVLDVVCQLDNLCGVKDTSGDAAYLSLLLEKYAGQVDVYVGDERLCYQGLSQGASGLVPSLANPFPEVMAAAGAAACREDWEACREHCGVVDRMNELNRFSDSWMSPNIWRKEALRQMGVIDGTFTHPHNPVGEQDKKKIAEWIAYYQTHYKTAPKGMEMN